MPELPLRFIPIGAILGDYEAGESLAMPPLLSPGGSRNLTFDKANRALSILGLRALSAPTANADGTALRVRHLHHHLDRPIGSPTIRTEYGLFENPNHCDLKVSLDAAGNWSHVVDLGTGCVGRIPSWAEMGTTVLLTTGATPVKKVTNVIVAGVVTGVTCVNAGAAQPAAPAIVDTGIGLLRGTKRWKFLAIGPDGLRQAASVSSAKTNLDGRKASVTWVAVAGAVSYEVYSTSGNGAIFFYEGTTTAGVVTWESNIADIDLVQNRVLIEHGDPPPESVRYLMPHQQRMLYIGTPTYPRRVYFSDPGLPESVYVDTNFIDCTDADNGDFGDEAVGGSPGFLGMAVIWLEKSVWTISGSLTLNNSILNAVRRRTSAAVGAVHGRAVAKVPAGASYLDDRGQLTTTAEVRLAYLTPFGDLRWFDGEHDTIIGYAKADTFARLSYDARRKAYCVTDTVRNEITWVFPADGNDECSLAVTWNYSNGTMVERSAWGALSHIAMIDVADNASVMIGGESNIAIGGFTYQLWDGLTLRDGASPINAAVMFKTLYGKATADEDETQLMSSTKRWRWVDLLVKGYLDGQLAGPITFTVECWPEEAEPTDAPYATATIAMPGEPVYSADGEPILSGDGSQLMVPIATPILRAKLRQVSATGKMRYLHSRGVRLRISSTTANLSWALVGANVAYQQLTGLQRRYHRPFKFATIAP